MEQASSIIKAIEKAWNCAEQPKEFTVKIFEKEEKNFFGITTKPAKIGIFFNDTSTILSEKHLPKNQSFEIKDKEPVIKQPKKTIPSQKAPIRTEQRNSEPKKTIHKINEQKQTIALQSKEKSLEEQVTSIWTTKMIDSTKHWMETTLSLMEKPISFTHETTDKNLKIIFAHPLIEDINQEKLLFRSLAHLVMSSLRNQYKQEIKDLKITLIRPS